MSLVQLGGFWVTPGNARDEQDSVDTAVKALDLDIASSAVPESFRASWRAFKAEWDAFYDEQGGVTGWFGRFLTAGGYEKALDYRRQLEAWRARFAELGGQPSGPGLVPKPETGSGLKYLAWTAGIAAGLWVAHTAYKEVTRGRSSTT